MPSSGGEHLRLVETRDQLHGRFKRSKQTEESCHGGQKLPNSTPMFLERLKEVYIFMFAI